MIYKVSKNKKLHEFHHIITIAYAFNYLIDQT